MILLTDTQSRLAITVGSVFLGTILLAFALISGNDTVVPPDLRASEEFVVNHKISNETLTKWILEGKRNFSLVGFRSESECLLQSGVTRHLKCYDIEKIDDLFWIRKQFPHLKMPMVVYGSNGRKSFYAAVRMRYYGYDARMLVDGFEGYFSEYLAPPIRPNRREADQAADSDRKYGRRLAVYRYLTDQRGQIYGSSDSADSIYLPERELPIVTGRVQSVFRKNRIVQITDIRENRIELIQFGPTTKFINAASYRDLIPGDIVEIKLEEDRVAYSITRKLIPFQSEFVIKTKRLADSLGREPEKLILVDVRSKWAYDSGHIPTAHHMRTGRMLQHLALLDRSKTKRVVVYGEGPTDAEIGKAFELLQTNGYRDIKVYTFGIHAWRKKRQLVVVDSRWLAKNLDPHHVLIDVRPHYLNQISHIKTAVPIEAGTIVRLGQKYSRSNVPARLRFLADLRDRSAPIVLYGIKSAKELPGKFSKFKSHPDVIDAYDELIAWNYENVAVLEGGFGAWSKNNPVVVGPNFNRLQYRSLQKVGSIDFPRFKSIQERGEAIVIDVRTDREVAGGIVKNAVHIALESLEEELPQTSKSQMIVVYCSNGFRAKGAYDILTKHGFRQSYYLSGGIVVDRNGSFRPN